MIETLRWVALKREALPGVIAEGQLPRESSIVDDPLSREGDLFIGSVAHGEKWVSSVVVLHEEAAREILAWLATYSACTFPLTQSIRTLTTADFRKGLASFTGVRVEGSVDYSYWPCVVFGELLGQSEHSSVALDSIALSRANACFSFAQARADEIYGASSGLSHECEQRLRRLEGDRLFVRRAISVEELSAIWKWARSGVAEDSIQGELARVIDDVVSERLVSEPRRVYSTLSSVGFDPRSLASGTIESRVRAFQSFVTSIDGVMHDGVSRTSAMLMAAAAMCVGNGTSHISLLDEIGRKLPSVYPWFGLFAGIAGPKAWDPNWNRAVNSMSRILKGRFELIEPPTSDLSWVEYDFVRDVPKPAEFVKHFPKLYPRLLSVEVVPGATCQLRMNDESGVGSVNAARVADSREVAHISPLPILSAPNQELTLALVELQRVLSHTQSIIQRDIKGGDASIGPSGQKGLFDQKPRKRSAKKSTKGDRA